MTYIKNVLNTQFLGMRRHAFMRHSGLVLLAGALTLISCRPSQQTRRSDTKANKNAQSGSKSTDSLLLVENHLVDLIDTMSTALEHDRIRIKNLEIEVARLKSQLEQQHVSGGNILPSMRTPLPPSGGAERNYTAPPPSGAIPQGGQLPTSGTNGPFTERYSKALQLFNEARYDESRQQFDDLVHADASSSYTPNYLYWRGESEYAMGRYEDAVSSFKSVMEGYPSSTKSDDAAFKIGESYEKLGKKNAARNAYEQLLAAYPDSEYKTRVQGRLKRLQ